MPFKDKEAKTDYMRQYMRKRRLGIPAGINGITLESIGSNKGSNKPHLIMLDECCDVRPKLTGVELMLYMERTSLEQLEREGYSIPNWRRLQG